MAIQTEPTRISTPFADAGTKNVIPETMAQPSATAAASWQAGFPTVCSLPLSAGGIPPARNDFNGLLNQMTQTERFLQDGGVFSWSADTDYGSNRLVLGSDGKLYWSAALSGPNTGAGAVDPTTDDGTYWGSVPMKAPGLGDKSAKVATTEWVKDLAVTPVYLDPAGDNMNDGMSAGRAVQTFAKALEIAKTLPQDLVVIKMSGGSYTGNINCNETNCIVELLGNVTINGTISLYTSTLSVIDSGQSYSIDIISPSSVNGSFVNVTETSHLNFGVDVNFDGSNTTSSSFGFIQCFFGSSCLFTKDVNIYQPNTDYNFVLNCGHSSSIHVVSGFAVSSGSGLANKCIISGTGSSIVFGENATATRTLKGKDCIDAWFCGCVSINDCLQIDFYFTRIGLFSQVGSGIYLASTHNVYFHALSAVTAIEVILNSSIQFPNNATIDFSGSVSWACVESAKNSSIDIPTTITFVNNLTGKRYVASSSGNIYVGGAGTNRIPGSADGTVDSASFSYYG